MRWHGNLRRETEKLSTVTLNNTLITNYIMAEIDKRIASVNFVERERDERERETRQSTA